MSSTEPLLPLQRKPSSLCSSNGSRYEAIPTRSSQSFELPEERQLSFDTDCGDNGPHKDSSLEEEEIYEERPWKYKVIALLCVLSLAGRLKFGCHVIYHIFFINHENFFSGKSLRRSHSWSFKSDHQKSKKCFFLQLSHNHMILNDYL